MLGRSYDLAAFGHIYDFDPATAKLESQRAIAVLTAATNRFPDHFETRRKLVRAIGNLGCALLLEGDVTGALETNSRAYKLQAELVAERPTSSFLRNAKAAILGEIGKDRWMLGSLRLAEVDLEQSRRDIDQVVSENPKVIEYRNTQGETHLYLGQVLAERGRTEQAKANLRKVIAFEQEQLGMNPNSDNSILSLMEGAAYLAGVERESGQFDLAPKRQESLGITRKEYPGSDLNDFRNAIESVRLASRTGEAANGRAANLETFLREWEEKARIGSKDQYSFFAVEGYLALSEFTSRFGSTTDVLEALRKAEAALAVVLRANPDRPRWRSLQARIETARGFALAGTDKAGEAKAAAERAVAIAEKLAREDSSYNYDLACALALQTRLEPAKPGPAEVAVVALRKAVEYGFDNAYKLENDDRLVPIRDRPDFKTLVQDARKQSAAPSRSDDVINR